MIFSNFNNADDVNGGDRNDTAYRDDHADLDDDDDEMYFSHCLEGLLVSGHALTRWLELRICLLTYYWLRIMLSERYHWRKQNGTKL